MRGMSSRAWSMGSPPVNSMRRQGWRASISAMISSAVKGLPPVKVYSESHQEQRRLQPARRTKMQGTPAKELSPWTLL